MAIYHPLLSHITVIFAEILAVSRGGREGCACIFILGTTAVSGYRDIYGVFRLKNVQGYGIFGEINEIRDI